MQPYQKAALAKKQQNEMPQNAVKGGIDMISQMAPLLSQYIPPLLALKGLSTLNSGIGSFIKAAGKSGQQPEQIVDFIRNKVTPAEENAQQEQPQQERATEQQNIIQRYAPSLYQEMKNMIDSGANPLQAATKLKNGAGIFANSIKQIENETKADWLSIVESIFGKGDMAQGEINKQPDPKEQMQQIQQSGQGQQALMQMLQKINQRMGQK